MDSMTFDEVKRICEILDQLNKKELMTKEDEKNRLDLCDELDTLIEGPENSRDLYRAGGLKILIYQMFKSKYLEVQKECLRIYSSVIQNDTLLQVASMDMGAFDLLPRFIREENISLKEGYFTALSSLLRGEFLAIKRLFVDKGGIELILVLLKSEKTSLRLKRKVLFLLRDLIYMD